MLFHSVMLPATCIPTSLEKRRPLPGDALVPEPIFVSTHAITIDAPPERVWPWIAQIGAGRAACWDAIDNGGSPSATGIMPALQTVASGDVMPAVPGATDAFVVAAVDPPRDLVLTVPDGRGGSAVAWEHLLDPLPGGRTLAIGFGATAFGKRFRLYSIATIVVLLAFGGLTFLEAPHSQANLPTPWIGLWERINISVFLLWIVILGAVLWRTGPPQGETPHVSPISVQDSRG